MRDQLDIFGTGPDFPAGFAYRAAVITPEEESVLLQHVQALPFRAFQFHGFVGKRRVVSFGWRYDFATGVLHQAGELPPFLHELREAAADVAGISAASFPHALVTEYRPGAAIGWHKDKDAFGTIVGISLLSPCAFRLRRAAGNEWERVSLELEPRSAYVLNGEARTEWEHSIPAVDALRYSVTFRTLREAEAPAR